MNLDRELTPEQLANWLAGIKLKLRFDPAEVVRWGIANKLIGLPRPTVTQHLDYWQLSLTQKDEAARLFYGRNLEIYKYELVNGAFVRRRLKTISDGSNGQGNGLPAVGLNGWMV